MNIKQLNEKLGKILEQCKKSNTFVEAEERYLRVEPGNSEFNDKFSASIVLYEGDKPVQSFGIDPRIVQDGDEKEIIEYAKQHFDNITDDIKVVWY